MADDETRERFAAFDRDSEARADEMVEKLGLTGEAAEAFRNHGRHWILLDGELVAVGLLEWAQWFEHHERRIVARDDIVGPDGQTYWVSTVFLGMDHNFAPGGPPLVFETMIFRRHEPRTDTFFGREHTTDKESTDYMLRYATLPEAKAGHKLAIEAVLNGNIELDEDSPT